VGFDIGRPEWTEQLHAMAEAGGGRYVQVDHAAELADRVAAAVLAEAPRFDVVDPNGTTVARGRFGDTVELEPGPYTLTFRVQDDDVAKPLHIAPGRTTRVHLDPTTPGR
jgi:hypothetical protein